MGSFYERTSYTSPTSRNIVTFSFLAKHQLTLISGSFTFILSSMAVKQTSPGPKRESDKGQELFSTPHNSAKNTTVSSSEKQ